jgi:cupin fold WbuC family metalloprotein
MIIINDDFLDSLTEQAKASPRLRMHYDLRNSADDNSQRMLNALEPGTVMPIHRHKETSETVMVIRGIVRWLFYDDEGIVTNTVVVSADGEVKGLSIPKGQWHSLEPLVSGSVVMALKDGKYEPMGGEDVLYK